ncbi:MULTISPECIES: septal ring lytic transglycosylase RlpA family protein [Emticicia]|uniref:septal ring lytic transglycosylase RlpA family protein n=1 Tax=Emticicia TaxID=312278 RepID=UPI0007D8A340|nr:MULTISPECIES: septal ring lytic transglycosylase RlpA family protein [Emticicia]
MILKRISLFFLFLIAKPLFIYSQNAVLGSESSGIASYYGKKFYGRKTASGEILKKGELTCAHPSLPFGTMLEVTNLANNKWCIVRVNDRGPFRRSRILDVSHDAAELLDMFQSGTAKVKAMVVGDNGVVIITRPESIIENSMNLVGPEEENKIAVINPPNVLKKTVPKPKKKAVKKQTKKKTSPKKAAAKKPSSTTKKK